MRIAAMCVAVLFYSIHCRAQAFKSDLTTLFAFQVHGIDDFFDRFNFKKNTRFQNFIKKNYSDYQLTRKKLILSLFDHKSAEINLSELDTFILQATDSIHPEFLKYRDIDWYAELRCKVFHKGKLKKLTLILKVEKSDQNAFRWSVVSAKADFLNYNYSKADSIYFKQLNEKFNKDSYFNPLYFLSPVCHGLDFMNIDNVFINKGHVNDYIYKGPYSIELSRLILQIQKSEIKFVQVNSVRYHLLQINGWILTVDNFERNEKNSGWLISRLFKASSSQKSDYLITKLNIPKS